MVREQNRCKIKCKYCAEIFESCSPNRKSCYKKECRLKALHDRETTMKIYRKKYNETEKGKASIARLPQKKKLRRNRIQEFWGNIGGTLKKEIWQQAEVEAVNYLRKEGFQNVYRLTELFPYFPFDVFAEKNGERHVFQVTVRTHVDDIRRRKELAFILGMNFRILYVKPDFKLFVLTDSNELAERHLKSHAISTKQLFGGRNQCV